MNISVIITRKGTNNIMTEGTEITKEKITYNRNDLLNEINNIPFHMPNSKGIFYYLPKSLCRIFFSDVEYIREGKILN